MLAALRLRPRWPTLVVSSSMVTAGSLEKRSTTSARFACDDEPSMRRYITPRNQGRSSADSVTSRAALKIRSADWDSYGERSMRVG